MRSLISSKRSPRNGQVIVMLVLLMVVLAGFVGLAVDAVFAFIVKSQLVTAVDSAALAATRALNQGSTAAQQQAIVNQTVAEMMASNFPAGTLKTSNLTYDPPTVVDNGDGTRTLSVLGHVESPTFFMRLLGWEHIPVTALGQSLRRDVVLTLVLDRSGSMNRAPGSNPGPTAFDDLKVAALGACPSIADWVLENKQRWAKMLCGQDVPHLSSGTIAAASAEPTGLAAR